MFWNRWNQNNPSKPNDRLIAVMAALALFLAACAGDRGAGGNRPAAVVGGDAERGWQAIQDYGCFSCHVIPGVPRANATVGPPLNNWANRGYIAGRLANTPENLILWIQFPQEVQPGTAMPDVGVAEQEARDMAAYLYTLSR